MGRRRLLVPAARQALQSMKLDIVSNDTFSAARQKEETTADQQAVNRSLPDRGNTVREADGASMTTREAGEKGGSVGGEMVKRLVEIAQKELAAPENERR